MTVRWWGILLCMAVVRPVAAQRSADSVFNHRRHGRLFATCTGCHEGIATGDVVSSMPAEGLCRGCHNGTDERVVRWRRTERPAGLLRFSHPSHASAADSVGRACSTCHAAPGGPWMDVRRPAPETCTQCHTHNTPHLAAENRCATCHVPLASAKGLTIERIARFPKPAWHERPDFSVAHSLGSALSSATCIVCHARESCAHCHVNAAAVPSISAMDRDPRVARIMAGRVPTYPVPIDHSAPVFRWGHGDAAREDVLRCGSCHARPSCEACHATSPSEVLKAMPVVEPGGARGVELIGVPARRRLNPPVALMQRPGARDTVTAPPPRMVRVHDPGFRTNHRTAAASNSITCASCHTQRYCTDCHAGETSRRFHPVNFAVRHAADGYRRDVECASCHNAEAFCRDCHRSNGLASRGRLDVAFHTAQPQWLLQHGRAARQGLANCTTCHAQRDCLTCHSTTGWGVNPHGPGFDARRLAKNTPTTCLRCHVKIPGQ